MTGVIKKSPYLALRCHFDRFVEREVVSEQVLSRDRVVRNLGEMKSVPQCKIVGSIVSFKIKAVYLSEEVLVTDRNPKKQGEMESVPQATLS